MKRDLATLLTLGTLLLLAGRSSWAAGFITVQARIVTTHIDAYARVEPIATLPVRTAQAGVVARIRVIPGSAVRAGQTLAQLVGPEIRALLTQDEGAVRSARARLAAARKSLARQRALLALHLSLRQAVADAQSAVAAANADFDAARERLSAAQGLADLRAPADGIVLTLNAADGERVPAGKTILTLQANNRLWLRADYYGTDAAAIRVGMLGSFVRSAGSVPIPVRVVSVFATLEPGGGESVGLRATAHAHWQSGEFGTVTLQGPQRSLVAVPTQALILDQGRWWVLVHTPQGYAPRAVVPGPTRGWQTFIDSGLAPGAQVLVENAYLKFHSGIAKSFQPAD